MKLTADTIRVTDNDGRFLLEIVTDEIGTLRVDIHSVALELESAVRRELRPYALEMEHARSTFPESYDSEAPQAEAFGPDHPKHPDYHDRMAAFADNR